MTHSNVVLVGSLLALLGCSSEPGGDDYADGASDKLEQALSQDATLTERLRVKQTTVPAGVKEGASNWRVWGYSSLEVAPVFVAPLTSCETLVCYTTETDGVPTARLVQLDSLDRRVRKQNLAVGFECRGLAAAPDGGYAALLWNDELDRMSIRIYDPAGTRLYAKQLVVDGSSATDFNIGDSRLEYGSGKYGAYYHVHSDSGHEGDALLWIDATTAAVSTGWGWGCSHSMSNVLRTNSSGQFVAGCVTDCYPGTSGNFQTNSIGGIYLNHDDEKIMNVDGGCNGSVAGELGSLAPAGTGYKLVFNAHQNPATLGQSSYNPATMNQDIGFSSIASDLSHGSVVWLTNTSNVNEADSSVARLLRAGNATEQYLVGWSEPGTTTTYKLARVGANGAFLEGPTDVSSLARWGRRDDPFRTHKNGDVIWAWFDDAGSTTLRIARVRSGNTCTP